MKKTIWRITLRVLLIGVIASMLIGLTACFNMHVVPAGYIGKILTPSGFQGGFLPPGQVNIGVGSCNGQQSRIVLLENTTITVVEKFRDASNSDDKQDHRIMTADGVPTVVDMYVRVTLPDSDEVKNQIFLTVTPVATGDTLESVITLTNIYARFVEMDTRNRVRTIISKYPNFQSIIDNYSQVNAEVARAIILSFKENNVPLKLQDAQLSQVLPDPQVWDSEVKKKSAEALQSQIETIGKIIAANPSYLEYLKWQALQNIAQTGSASGVNTIIITDGTNQNVDANSWGAMQTILNELEKLNNKATPTPTTTTAPK